MRTPENTTTKIDGKPVAPDEEAIPGQDGAAASAPEDPAAAMKAELDKLRDQALRDRADLENTRKRLQREKEDAVKYANKDLLERLLPVLDNFELGLSAARQSGEGSAVLSGMSMVQKQLEDFARENGLLALEPVGQKFDPNLHEALGEEASAEVPEGHVVRQTRKGYKLKERLLRPANVFVSKGQA